MCDNTGFIQAALFPVCAVFPGENGLLQARPVQQGFILRPGQADFCGAGFIAGLGIGW